MTITTSNQNLFNFSASNSNLPNKNQEIKNFNNLTEEFQDLEQNHFFSLEHKFAQLGNTPISIAENIALSKSPTDILNLVAAYPHLAQYFFEINFNWSVYLLGLGPRTNEAVFVTSKNLDVPHIQIRANIKTNSNSNLNSIFSDEILNKYFIKGKISKIKSNPAVIWVELESISISVCSTK